jgi:hypothetical protein
MLAMIGRWTGAAEIFGGRCSGIIALVAIAKHVRMIGGQTVSEDNPPLTPPRRTGTFSSFLQLTGRKGRVAVEWASTSGCIIGMKTHDASTPLKELRKKFWV